MVTAICGGVCGIGVFLVLRIQVWDGSSATLDKVRRRLVSKSIVDRRILDISDEAFVVRLMGSVVLGLTSATIGVYALARLAVGMPAALSLVVILCGAVLPAAVLLERLKKNAAGARRTFSYALSSYLDLASVLLAGGAGSETALNAAAATGRSWSFALIRQALDGARAGRIPSWRVFDELGKEYGIVDLERLGGSMQLAGEQGAKVRTSLSAQAEALRTRQIAEVEAEAQAATERMGIPTVLLFVGFIALLGYPALNLVVGQM